MRQAALIKLIVEAANSTNLTVIKAWVNSADGLNCAPHGAEANTTGLSLLLASAEGQTVLLPLLREQPTLLDGCNLNAVVPDLAAEEKNCKIVERIQYLPAELKALFHAQILKRLKDGTDPTLTNNIGDAVATLLAEVLTPDTTITMLEIGDNTISDVGAIALADLLRINRTITLFGFAKADGLTQAGAEVWLKVIEENTTITDLHLDLYMFYHSHSDKKYDLIFEASEYFRRNLTLINVNDNLIQDWETAIPGMEFLFSAIEDIMARNRDLQKQYRAIKAELDTVTHRLYKAIQRNDFIDPQQLSISLYNIHRKLERLIAIFSHFRSSATARDDFGMHALLGQVKTQLALHCAQFKEYVTLLDIVCAALGNYTLDDEVYLKLADILIYGTDAVDESTRIDKYELVLLLLGECHSAATHNMRNQLFCVYKALKNQTSAVLPSAGASLAEIIGVDTVIGIHQYHAKPDETVRDLMASKKRTAIYELQVILPNNTSLLFNASNSTYTKSLPIHDIVKKRKERLAKKVTADLMFMQYHANLVNRFAQLSERVEALEATASQPEQMTVGNAAASVFTSATLFSTADAVASAAAAAAHPSAATPVISTNKGTKRDINAVIAGDMAADDCNERREKEARGPDANAGIERSTP